MTISSKTGKDTRNAKKVTLVLNEGYKPSNICMYASVVKLLKYPEVGTKDIMEKYNPPILTKPSKLGVTKGAPPRK